MMQVNRVTGKTLKESSISAATSAQGVKYRKPKPTHPKPFRLRTDVCELFQPCLFKETVSFSFKSDVN